ncbi:hypothetical protein [Nocardia carnea]|nr:hypothetical protein [Nocardia carnea]
MSRNRIPLRRVQHQRVTPDLREADLVSHPRFDEAVTTGRTA